MGRYLSTPRTGVSGHWRVFHFALIGLFVLTAMLLASCTPANGQSNAVNGQPADQEAPGEIKVAFISDTGFDEDFPEVLDLILAEGAEMVIHQGDFDEERNPDAAFAIIDEKLGPDFPFFFTVGNHDAAVWDSGCGNPQGCYSEYLSERLARLGVTPDDPDLNDQMYSVSFRGLKMVFVGEDLRADDPTYANFIDEQLTGDEHTWKICSWHEEQEAMQVGNKRDSMGWAVYETCRKHGAFIVTGHVHIYSRTHTLIDMEHQVVDPEWPDPASVRVAPGATFVAVPSLGGASIREQVRCLPTEYPYGCFGEWAKIYSSSQGADYGALFITFNVGGDPNKAHAYFKNVRGEVIDEFTITAQAEPVGLRTAVLYPDADTFVSARAAAEDFSGEPVLEVDGDPEKIAYLRFDLSDVDRSAVLSAALRLKVEDSSRDELTLSIVDGGWQRDELTYDRRPPEGTAIATVGGGREGGWLQVDIAGTIRQASGDELTIAVASEGSDGIDFTSSEAVVDQPHLVLVLED